MNLCAILMRVSELGCWALIEIVFESISVRRQVGYLTVPPSFAIKSNHDLPAYCTPHQCCTVLNSPLIYQSWPEVCPCLVPANTYKLRLTEVFYYLAVFLSDDHHGPLPPMTGCFG